MEYVPETLSNSNHSIQRIIGVPFKQLRRYYIFHCRYYRYFINLIKISLQRKTIIMIA